MGAGLVSNLEFRVVGWLAAEAGDPHEKETLASIQITAGPAGIVLTEVEDTLTHAVRSHINVPAYAVAHWLLANWWRLRWEPLRRAPSRDWTHCHSMSALGKGYAWPPLVLSSDGEFIQLRLESELTTDVSTIRYLRDLTVDIPAEDFEAAVDRFVAEVEAQLSTRLPGDGELSELRQELQNERADAAVATECKLQALAGIDPGTVTDGWLRDVRELAVRAGDSATEEILAVVPAFEGGLADADAAISAMRDSDVRVQLGWASAMRASALGNEVPWVRGARLAGEIRRHAGVAAGPISRDTLEGLLGVKLPLTRSAWTKRHLLGGYRNGARDGRTAVLMTKAREDGQRFYLARMIAAACSSSPDEHVLPVSDADTAFQKLERSFAQEFLCPWQELDAFTDDRGTDEDGVAEAAEHFMVSEHAIITTLVNKRKIPRSRLPA